MRTAALKFSLLLVFAASAGAYASQPVKTLVWDDLVPKMTAELVDPLAGHELYRRLELETIIWAAELTEGERNSSDLQAGVADAEHYATEMRQQGIDPDRLVQDYKIWKRAVEERDQQVVEALDQRQIKIAGYLLPLEFSDEGEKEFLLVPYVGACIHTPAPPPNQIVFVELNQSYKAEDLYAPVWITGTMRTKQSKRSLSFVDGAADIPVGYTLQAKKIEVYTE